MGRDHRRLDIAASASDSKYSFRAVGVQLLVLADQYRRTYRGNLLLFGVQLLLSESDARSHTGMDVRQGSEGILRRLVSQLVSDFDLCSLKEPHEAYVNRLGIMRPTFLRNSTTTNKNRSRRTCFCLQQMRY